MRDEIVGRARSDAQNVREERLRRKLHRELGPVVLEALADEKTIEVMVNPDGRVWWDRLGDGQSLLPDEFSAERAESLVGTVAALLDTVANEEHPIVEGELPFFGFRFEGVVPPVAPRATVAIRKHSSQVRTLDDYVVEHRLSPSHAHSLREAVRGRLNIIVTGGTASGKTTFVNALLWLPAGNRPKPAFEVGPGATISGRSDPSYSLNRPTLNCVGHLVRGERAKPSRPGLPGFPSQRSRCDVERLRDGRLAAAPGETRDSCV